MYKLIKVNSSIGAPKSDSGMEKGPSVLAELVMQKKYKHLHSTLATLNPPRISNFKNQKYENAKNLPLVKSICRNLKEQVYYISRTGNRPLVLMGDDSSAIGVLYGILQKNPDVGVVWFDAHADLNTPETSPSGCFYGMGLAHLLGYGQKEILQLNNNACFVRKDNVIMIGQRNFDAAEIAFIDKHKITKYSPQDVRNSFTSTLKQIKQKLYANKISTIFLHYDLDVIDPLENPAVFSPVDNGLSVKELQEITKYLKENFNIAGTSIANYVPKKDSSNSARFIFAAIMDVLLN